MTIRTVLVGCGRWGTTLLRALDRHPAYALVALVDPDSRALGRAARLVPGARATASLRAALRAGGIDAAVVASPTGLHAGHARRCIEARLDVLVEKPLATSMAEASALCEAAARAGVVGMVGHLLRYHPFVERLVELVRAGHVGTLCAVSAVRATQSGSPDPLWTLAPHDLATLAALDPSPVLEAHASARSGGVELRLVLQSGLRARLLLTTRAQIPTRRLFAHGPLWALGIDELDQQRPLWLARACPTALLPPCSVPLDDPAPPPPGEPLMLELDHFAACVRRRAVPLTAFADGAAVVAIIETALGNGLAASAAAASAG